MPQLNVLIQINLPGAKSRNTAWRTFRIFPGNHGALRNLRLRGVMYFPPQNRHVDESPSEVSKSDKPNKVNQIHGYPVNGNQRDYEADDPLTWRTTMIRLGTTIFGPRVPGTWSKFMTKYCFIGGGNMAKALILVA